MARPVTEPATQPHSLTGAESSLFEVNSRSERLLRMSPERRATYERIVKLREELGPVDFDIAEAVQDLRQDG